MSNWPKPYEIGIETIENFSGKINFDVVARAVEGSNSNIAISDSKNVSLDINPIADVPIITLSQVNAQEDQISHPDIGAAISVEFPDADESAVVIIDSIPSGVTSVSYTHLTLPTKA